MEGELDRAASEVFNSRLEPTRKISNRPILMLRIVDETESVRIHLTLVVVVKVLVAPLVPGIGVRIVAAEVGCLVVVVVVVAGPQDLLIVKRHFIAGWKVLILFSSGSSRLVNTQRTTQRRRGAAALLASGRGWRRVKEPALAGRRVGRPVLERVRR